MDSKFKLKKFTPTKFMLPTSRYDKSKADHAVAFIQNLKHTKGEWAGQKFQLIAWQEELIRNIFGVVKKNGYRQFNNAFVETSKKSGKALAVTTPIPTPHGFIKMGDIKVGDKVFDENGTRCSVIACSNIMYNRSCYKVWFSDGGSIIADAEHLWQVNMYTPYRKPYYKTKILITEEMKDNIKHNNGCYNYRIPIPTKNSFKTITAIEPVESQPVKCIQVNSKSHLYLAGRNMTPTHNSELAAAVALYLLCADGEMGGEIYSCAADTKQASIVFNVARDMVIQSPALMKRVKILNSQKRIVYYPTRSVYQVLSSDVATKFGYSVHGCIFDELLAQPDRKLYDVMTKGAGMARRQPLNFVITTAGSDRNSICYEVHQKAQDILERRKKDSTFYPKVFCTPMDADWTDPKVWRKSNPSLGVTFTEEDLQLACESAKSNPAEEMFFRQFFLCQWTSSNKRWMPMDVWDKCSFEVNLEKLIGRECYGGLDLSSSIDITAFVLVFPPTDTDDKYYVLPYFWIPEDNLKLRVRRDHVPYDIWKKQGYLQTTEGNVIHYGFIENFIDELGTKFNIKEIAFDRWGAVQMVQNLEGLGFIVVPFGQGYKDMSPPTKELMKITLEQKIAHGAHPVLSWMMDNVYVRTDPAGNIKPDKSKSTEKIDGVVALIMALDRAIRREMKENIYEKRGMRSLLD